MADGEVEQGVVEDGDDGQEDRPYRERRPPPPPEDVQRHLPLRADVGMVHLQCRDAYVWVSFGMNTSGQTNAGRSIERSCLEEACMQLEAASADSP